MLDELKDHFILCGFGRMGEIIAREFSRQSVPFVIIERDPERMQSAMEDGLPGRRGGRLERRGAAARAHRARAGIRRRGQHRCRERVCRAQRAPAPAGPVHHRPRGDRRCADEAAEGGRRPRHLAVSHRRPAARADGAAPGGGGLRAARHVLREPGSESGAGTHRAGLAARRPDPRRRGPPSAIWRGRRRHPPRPTAAWTSIPIPRRPCTPATISSSSAAAEVSGSWS